MSIEQLKEKSKIDDFSNIIRTLEEADKDLSSLEETVGEETKILETPKGSVTDYVSLNLATIYKVKNLLTGVDFKNLERLMGEIPISSTQGNIALLSEIADLSVRIDNTIKAIEDQGETFKRTTETLKRYGRETRLIAKNTRNVLKGLVEYLKREKEEGGITTTIVGSYDWTLNNGETLALGRGSAFTFEEGINRSLLFRQPYMLKDKKTKYRKFIEAFKSCWMRLMAGESFILDYYTSNKDNARLGISPDEVGVDIISLDLKDLESKELIIRPKVFFGMEPGVMFTMYWPIKKYWPGLKKLMNLELKEAYRSIKKTIKTGLKEAIYGPAFALPKLKSIPEKDKTMVFLHVDGDKKIKRLERDKKIKIDPRYLFAWESTVNYKLTGFGSILGRVLSGDIPYWVELNGPGVVIHSDVSFSEGYSGYKATPYAWGYLLKEKIRPHVPFA